MPLPVVVHATEKKGPPIADLVTGNSVYDALPTVPAPVRPLQPVFVHAMASQKINDGLDATELVAASQLKQKKEAVATTIALVSDAKADTTIPRLKTRTATQMKAELVTVPLTLTNQKMELRSTITSGGSGVVQVVCNLFLLLFYNACTASHF